MFVSLHPMQYFDRAGQAWYHAKVFLEHSVGFSHDALHVIVGVCLQLVAAAVLRLSVHSFRPWLTVLAFELVNELIDQHLEEWTDLPMQWGESAKDILLTMALPTAFLLVSRYRPQIFR